MHILSPETDNCPSWISGRERMTVENISWSISTKECCRPRRGLNPRPPGLQSDGASNWATEDGLWKTDPFIYFIVWNDDLFIYCSLIFIPIHIESTLRCLYTCLQIKKNTMVFHKLNAIFSSPRLYPWRAYATVTVIVLSLWRQSAV